MPHFRFSIPCAQYHVIPRNTAQYHAIPRNTNFVSDAPLKVLKARKEKEGLSKEEVRTKE